MKRFLLLILLLGSFCFTKAQNLVPNYSFEDTIQCINSDNEFNGYVANWTGQVSYGGLCYNTSQCYSSNANVPYNIVGFQYAHTGVSYAGITTFANGSTTDTIFPYSGNFYKDARNYIETQLTSSLKAGSTYYVTFYVSLANIMWYACGDIGAYFSDSALNFNGYIVKSYLTPQVANNPKKQELTDTLNWMKISGNFIAKGGEQYIIIGDFKNDSVSSIKYLGENTSAGSGAYYYIDDVIVSPDSNYADSLAGVAELKIKNEEIKVFPNPSKGLFQLIISNEQLGIKSTIEVYNALGQKVYSQLSILNSQFSIDLSKQPSGIYLYRVITEDGDVVGTGKLIIN